MAGRPTTAARVSEERSRVGWTLTKVEEQDAERRDREDALRVGRIVAQGEADEQQDDLCDIDDEQRDEELWARG
jgi:hypothetical protein